MTSFQRARSDEQRTVRRRMILDTAAAMLTEMPVARVSLNELSRRVGLAKSNVLRYFESREAVLLELLDSQARAWLAELAAELSVTPGDAYDRADQVAAGLVTSLAPHPVLCDLVSAQASELERNVSPEVAARYKRSMFEVVAGLARLVLRHVPELGEGDALRFAAAAVIVTGSVWTHSQPPPAMLAAYEIDPALAAMRIDFADTLRQLLEILLTGLLARAAR